MNPMLITKDRRVNAMQCATTYDGYPQHRLIIRHLSSLTNRNAVLTALMLHVMMLMILLFHFWAAVAIWCIIVLQIILEPV